MPDHNDEQFVQRRLLLASLLSAAVILGYFYTQSLFAPPAPAPEPGGETAAIEQPATPQSPTPAAEPDAAAEPTDGPEIAAANGPEQVVAASEQEIVVESDAFRAVFSNRGAVVKSWTLKNYKSSAGEPLDLVNQEGAKEHGFPFTFVDSGGEKIPAVADALFRVNEGPAERMAPTTLEFELVHNGVRARKTFHFDKQGYVFEVNSELTQNGTGTPHRLAWTGGFGDTAHQQDWIYSKSFYFDPEGGEIEWIDADDAEDAVIANRGAFPFVGLEDHFFTAVFLPEEGSRVALETSAVELRPQPDSTKTETYVAVSVGGETENQFHVFVGPKDVDELQKVDPRMRNIVDFGFFGFIAEPIFLMMRWMYDNVVANWGWTIVIVTIIINLALFPLKWKGSRSMKRMQQLQPLVQEINEKYRGLSMKDPRKQEQNEELMALYKKYNVNPVGGCLPMLLQLPFFYGFYRLLTVAIEMRQAEWLWVTDLSQPETLPIRVLPLAMMATQFWMQSMTPTPAADPAQMRVMKFMPLMMGFIFYGFQSGLVLYWLTSNLVGVAQQALLNKLPGESLDIELARPRGKKRKK
ncbi:MAG: membrane protein insertase YidC [Acidobacteria bacterium]|nr:membrane protein insertase YidC [Acidobacteriota bacterium]